jgi:hypothetical protein
MSGRIEEVVDDLSGILDKITERRTEMMKGITEGSVEDEAGPDVSRFDSFLGELDEDLDVAAERFRELCKDASEGACSFYETLIERIGRTREDIKLKRMWLTGRVGERALVVVVDEFHERVDEIVADTKRWSGEL